MGTFSRSASAQKSVSRTSLSNVSSRTVQPIWMATMFSRLTARCISAMAPSTSWSATRPTPLSRCGHTSQ